MLFSDHEVLRYLNSLKKLNPHHAKWVEFLQEYSFVMKHKVGIENKPTNALSHKVALLHSMSVEVIGFEQLMDEYPTCSDFGELYTSLLNDQSRSNSGFVLLEGFLFKGNKLCISRTSLRDFLVWELHVGGIAGHFGCDKTIAIVEDQFHWPSLKRYVTKIIEQCRTCQLAKQRKQNTRLYTPLPVPHAL